MDFLKALLAAVSAENHCLEQRLSKCDSLHLQNQYHVGNSHPIPPASTCTGPETPGMGPG